MKLPQSYPRLRAFLPTILILCLLGWGGLVVIITQTEPTVWPRWLFFALLFLALSGTSLPAVWFLNLRFPSASPVGSVVLVREAIWVGVYGTTLAWLQLGRLVSLGVALGLAAGLIAIEYFIQWRERSRWRPASPAEPSTASSEHPAPPEPPAPVG